MLNVIHKWRAKIGWLHRDLSSILSDADPRAPLGIKIAWIEELLNWVRTPIDPDKERTPTRQIQAVRVRFFLQVIDRNPIWKAAVSDVFGTVLIETDPLNLFCLTGLSRQGHFIGEALDRSMRKILPSPRNENDLSELFVRIFRDEDDSIWLETLDSVTLHKLYDLIAPTPERRQILEAHYNHAIGDALTIISSQVESLGFSPEIRVRTRVKSIRDSTFWQLRILLVKSQRELRDEPGDISPRSADREELVRQIQACRRQIDSAHLHLEEHGVSVAIVYRLAQLEWLLDRFEALVRLRFAGPTEDHAHLWLTLLAELVRDTFENSRLSTLVQDNLHLLARKIVERSGVSGEHYITQTKREYVGMLLSAGGGGVLTVGTTMTKFAIGSFQAALFIEGFLSWLNYAGSFLLMQAAHFTLATKQPSMTAPALAAKLKNLRNRSQIHGFVDEVTKITRSQFAAAIGNVGLVIPTAFLVDQLYFTVMKKHILTSTYAVKTVESLDPFNSPTIPFAVITGVLLWLSSLCAGWLENWITYRRLPEAIEQSHLLRRSLGPERAKAASAWLARNISGIGGNISLGGLLAFSSVFGRFFGIPIDVRHVTLSAGALTFALCAVPSDAISSSEMFMAWLGIVIIGMLNFGVSFALALYVAVKARKIKRNWLTQLWAYSWLRMRYRPLDFFFPTSIRPIDEGSDSAHR